MHKTMRSLYERYRDHHAMGQPLLEWIGVVGSIAFPLFYLLRRAVSQPPLYDDLWLRVVGSLMCLGLALHRWWPVRLQRFYITYSYATVFYCLSFLLSFTMLKNQGGTPSVVNMVMGAIIIILLADWRNTVVILLAGYVVSTAVYLATDAAPRIPPEFVFSAAGSLLVVVAGALSHYGQKRAELERMRRIYAGLAGSIAHEVRTPLAQVQHAFETIAGLVPPGSPAATAVAQGERAVRRGLQSISITLQELSQRPLDPRNFIPLSAAACVRKAVEEYAYESESQRQCVSLRVLRDFTFRGEETVFELVLFNLLKNALYYLPLHPDATIEIRVESVPSPRVVVRDTGPGIAPELLPRLFREFETVGKAKGTGLGLAFCRRAMRAFGGDIGCHSVHGEFTEFTLTLPETDQPAVDPVAAEALADPNAAVLAGRTVLVVDDSALNRAIARARLAEMGAHVVEASHATEALRLVHEGPAPDAILMDMNMPGMSGIEAARQLRAKDGPSARIPLLAVTANPSSSAREAALAAGMDAYLVKPLLPALLRSELLRVLQTQPAAPESTLPLLEGRRLAELRELGLLHELASACVEEIAHHCVWVKNCAQACDAAGAQQALHSLLGVSGEAGALALYELTQGFYATLLQGRWPASADWPAQLEAVAQQTQRAIREQAAAGWPLPAHQTVRV